jgi:Arc/MetJ family transcription regulator
MANILNLSGLTVLEVKETATEINVSAVSATYSRMCPLCAIDIRRPYREAVHAALPNATIVVDKYHVARMGNESLERVRRGLNVELPGKLRIGLKHDRNQVGRMSRRLFAGVIRRMFGIRRKAR